MECKHPRPRKKNVDKMSFVVMRHAQQDMTCEVYLLETENQNKLIRRLPHELSLSNSSLHKNLEGADTSPLLTSSWTHDHLLDIIVLLDAKLENIEHPIHVADQIAHHRRLESQSHL